MATPDPFSNFEIVPPTQEQVDRNLLRKSIDKPLPSRLDLPKNLAPEIEGRLKEKTEEIDPNVNEGFPIEFPRPKVGDTDWKYTNLYASMLTNTAAGFNKYLSDVTQPFIQAPTAFAAEKVLGLEEGSLDRNYLERVLNSADFESQQDIIPWIMSYGKGQKGTFSDWEKLWRSGGYNLGLTATFATPHALMAQSQHAAMRVPLLTHYTQKYGDKLGKTKLIQGALFDSMVQPWRNSAKTTAMIEGIFGALGGVGMQKEQEMVDKGTHPLGFDTGFGGMLPLYPIMATMAVKEVATNLGKGAYMTANAVREWSLLNSMFKAIGRKFENMSGKGPIDAEFTVIAETPNEAETLAKIAAGEQVSVDPQVKSKVLDEIDNILDDPASIQNLKRTQEIEAEIQMEAGPFNLAERTLNPMARATARDIQTAKTPEQNLAALNLRMSRIQDITKWLSSKWGGLTSEGPLYLTNAMNNRLEHFTTRLDDELLTIDAPPVGAMTPESGIDDQTLINFPNSSRLLSNLDTITGQWETVSYPQKIQMGQDIRNTVIQYRDRQLDDLAKWANKKGVGTSWSKVSTQKAYNQLIKQIAQSENLLGLVPRKTQKDLLYDPDSLVIKGLPKPVRDLLAHHAGSNKLTGLPGKRSLKFTEWQFQRKAIMQEIGEAKAHGNGAKLATLSAVAKHLDAFGAQFGKTYDNIREYNDSYKLIRDQFEHGDLIKMTQSKIEPLSGSNKTPIYVIDDELIADYTVKSPERVKSFMNLMKMYPEDESTVKSLRAAHDVMYGKLADELLSKPVKNFASREARRDVINNFLRTNEGVLTELGLGEEFSTAANSVNAIMNKVAKRKADLEHRKNVVNNSQLYTHLSKAFKKQMPEELFEEAVTNTTLMRQLRAEALKLSKKTPKLINAFNTGVWEGIRRNIRKVPGKDSNVIFDEPEYFNSWLAQPETKRTLVAGLGPKHYEDLVLAADAAERVFAIPLPEGIAQTGAGDFITNIQGVLGSTVQSIGARLTAAAEGRISTQYAATWILARGLTAQKRREAMALMERALYDPELANIMSTKLPEKTIIDKGGKIVHPVETKLRAYLMSIGFPHVDDIGDDAGFRDVEGGEPLRGRISPKKGRASVEPTQVESPPVELPPVELPPVAMAPAPTTPMNPAQYGAMFPRDELGQAIAQQGVAPGGLGDLA